MTYAGDRPIHDADGHLMESPNWLRSHADARTRRRLDSLDLHGLDDVATATMARRAGQQPEWSLDAVLTSKNWEALGAYDRDERSAALDILGFRSQLVFSTYSHLVLINSPHAPPGACFEPDVLYGAVDAHNRGMAEFCADDPRLLAVGFVALDDAGRAQRSAELAIDLGCVALEVPSYPAAEHSLTHRLYDPIYAALEECGLPLVFHVGGGSRLVDPVFAENGLTPERIHHERETALPTLTYIGIPAPLEMSVAALILDGVLERFPNLKIGVIEQGATWVPGLIRRLDTAIDEFGRSRQRARLSRRPSEYFEDQVRVTPFHYEDISWIIRQCGSQIFMFGSDYPHDEGGSQPLELFDAHLEGFDPETQADVTWRAFEDLIGEGLPDAQRVDRDEPRAPDVAARADRTGESLAVHRKRALLRVLVRDAATRMGITAEHEEIAAAIDEFRRDHGLLVLDDTLRWMDDENVSEDMLARVMADGVLAAKIAEKLELDEEIEQQLRLATARSLGGRSR